MCDLLVWRCAFRGFEECVLVYRLDRQTGYVGFTTTVNPPPRTRVRASDRVPTETTKLCRGSLDVEVGNILGGGEGWLGGGVCLSALSARLMFFL